MLALRLPLVPPGSKADTICNDDADECVDGCGCVRSVVVTERAEERSDRNCIE